MSKMSDSDADSDINGSIYDPEDNLNVHIWLSDVSKRVVSNNDVDVDEEQTAVKSSAYYPKCFYFV